METSRTNNSGGKKLRGRRRSYLINPAFQWKYTILVVVGVFILSTFMSYVLFGVLHQQARSRVLNPAVIGVWENAVVIGLAGLAFAAALALAFGLWTILITHRICGPMFVIEGYFNDLKEGRLPTPRPLRKKDELKDLYDAFGSTIDALKASKRSELAQLTEAFDIAQSGVEGNDEKRKQALESLAGRIENMGKKAAGALGDEFTSAPVKRSASAGPASKRPDECVEATA